HWHDYLNVSRQLICLTYAQSGVRTTVGNHKNARLASRGLSLLRESRVVERICVGNELPQAALAAVVRVDDRIEVKTEIDIRGAAADCRSERDTRDRLRSRAR